MTKQYARAKNAWHMEVALFHLEALKPDMIPRECTKTWTRMMRQAVILRDALQADIRTRGEGSYVFEPQSLAEPIPYESNQLDDRYCLKHNMQFKSQEEFEEHMRDSAYHTALDGESRGVRPKGWDQ